MSKKLMCSLFATTALTFALPATAFAADAAPASAPAPASETAPTDTGDIIVTARRDSENGQNVPVSLQAISGREISNLAITDATEISKLAAGLNITNASADTPVIILRGIRWTSASGTPAIPVYFNEIPFDPQNTVQSIFDVEQIEVLRGPQGTERGAPSIAGAITIRTRRPDLYHVGGYVSGLFGEGGHGDAQGAVNVPIVKGVLAIRVAADVEQDNLNRIHSLYNSTAADYKSAVFRATALFEPTDTLQFEVMYQRRRQKSLVYDQVIGTGSPGFAALGIPANFNGPALTLADRASVEAAPNINYNDIDLITANASWQVLGQELTYNYGRQISHNPRNYQVEDTGGVIPGVADYQSYINGGTPKFFTQEVRLSSAPHPDQLFDYDIGFFQKHSGGPLLLTDSIYLPGAFGAPFVTPPGAVRTPVSPYVLTANTDINLGQVYDSFYGNLKLHIGSRTELSGGASHIRDRVPVVLGVTTSAALADISNPVAMYGLSCVAAGLLASPYGTAYCDAPVPATASTTNYNNTYNKNIYHFSLSHRFSDSVLAYATTGSSYRSGLPPIGNTGIPASVESPLPETAKSYEVGLKTNMARSFHFNADVFQIDYKNQLTQFTNVQYYNSVSGGISTTSAAFFGNVDARVRGVEVDASLVPFEHLSLSASFSYSKISSRGGNVPCNNPNGPALDTANPINFCPSASGQTLNDSPEFQASVNGNYTHSLGQFFDGYLRFNVDYQGHNPNYGTSVTPTPAYALVDLFAGLSEHRGAWDLGLYAKNVFNKQALLTSQPVLNSVFASYATPVGYNEVLTTQPREVGLTLRYAFGTR